MSFVFCVGVGVGVGVGGGGAKLLSQQLLLFLCAVYFNTGKGDTGKEA